MKAEKLAPVHVNLVNSTLRPLHQRPPVIRVGFAALIALMLLYTAVDGLRSGWSEWLPGSMSRHRDAVAVALTAVSYGHWEGYASFRAVNRILREHGFSVHDDELARVGVKHYFDVMKSPSRYADALKAAANLEDPAAEGMYYSQDEKGMAAFYTFAFLIFGVSPSSWFWLYITLYSASVLVTCYAFRKHEEVLFFVLAITCTHAAVAHVLPIIPPQDINVIFGNRFIGIMSSVAAFHLMLLVLKRTPLSFLQICGAAFQTSLIYLTINARTSAVWLLVAVVLMWVAQWIHWLYRRRIASSYPVSPVSWPIVILAIGFTSLIVNQRFVQDEAFRDGRAYGGHVFWHNLTTALHNNPLRTERYGIPAEYPVYDDQVTFILFDRELVERGDRLANYIVGDADWEYRTNVKSRDFRWASYDKVVGDIFWRTIKNDPGYAAYSFFVQQPKSAISVIWSSDFLRSQQLRQSVPIAALAIGVLLVAWGSIRNLPSLFWILGASTAGASLPVLAAAAVELRVVELFYMLLLDMVFGAALLLAAFIRPRSYNPSSGDQ